MWKIEEVKFNINEEIDLKKRIAEILDIKIEDILFLEILKKSIDARKKNVIYINFSVKVIINEKILKEKELEKQLIPLEKEKAEEIVRKKKHTREPVIVGTGPAGLFSALTLVEKNYRPLIIERGKKVGDRIKDVNLLWKKGILNQESNVQFGEGGAGTFSDGKLVCRKKDKTIRNILKTFVEFGAPKEILYESKPHGGTDLIRKVVTNIREYLKSRGAVFSFSTKLTDIGIKEGKIHSITHSKGTVETDSIILATGHSSRDTYYMLEQTGIALEPKGFAIGFRIEHDQDLIDRAQFGKYAGHPLLGTADYFLKYNDPVSKRGIYSFCMCPGGTIVCASSEKNKLVINGMSNYKRDSKKANAAIVVSVYPKDYYVSSAMDGINFQRKYEETAFLAGGGNYIAPAQHTLSFLERKNKGLALKTTYLPGIKKRELKKCLPEFLIIPLKKGLETFCRKIRGFENSILIGLETRTSSPVRIIRDPEKRHSLNTEGLYPVGEGAGYAGGIISSALDGINTAKLF